MDRDYDAEFAAIIADYEEQSADEPPTATPRPSAESSDTAEPRPTPPPFGGVINPSPIRPVQPRERDLDSEDDRRATPAPEPTSDTTHPSDDGPYAPAPPRETPPPGIVEAGLEEGHFEPPPVNLPPQEDLHFWGVVIGLVAGPLLLLWVVFFADGESPWWGWLGTLLTLGGFALLVLRQPTERDEDDDGARV